MFVRVIFDLSSVLKNYLKIIRPKLIGIIICYQKKKGKQIINFYQATYPIGYNYNNTKKFISV